MKQVVAGNFTTQSYVFATSLNQSRPFLKVSISDNKTTLD